MTLNADNVVSGIYTGAAYWGALTAPAPTGLNSELPAAYDDLGYLNEEGPTLTLPGEGESTPVRVWQNAAIIRVIRQPSDESPNFQLTLVENKRGVVELAFGSEVNQTAVAGSYVINGNIERQHGRFVLDVVAEQGVRRYYAPNAVVTAVEELTFPNDGTPAGYTVTIAADFSTEINGQIQVWDSNLRTGAARDGGLGGNHAEENLTAADFAGNLTENRYALKVAQAYDCATAPAAAAPEVEAGAVPLYEAHVVEDVQQVVNDVARLTGDYNQAVTAPAQ